MEFPFDVNELFREEYVKVDNRLLPMKIWNERLRWSNEELKRLQDEMRVVLDDMGNASALAQQLHQVITNADRLKFSDHFIYFMTDRNRAEVIGFLKIGPKKLFVYDQNGSQHEKIPMCVLDFYVHESKQRIGCGRRLFEHMLDDLRIRAHHLAVDRPSDKFLCFLRKHYKLTHSIPQINNFVIFEGFFDGQVDWSVGVASRRASVAEKAENEKGSVANGKRHNSGAMQLEDTHFYTPRLPFCRQTGMGSMTPTVGSAVGQGVAGLGSGVGHRTTMAEIMHSNGGSDGGRKGDTDTSCPHSPVLGGGRVPSRNQGIKSENLAKQLSECTVTPSIQGLVKSRPASAVQPSGDAYNGNDKQQYQPRRPSSPSPSPTPASSPAPNLSPPLSMSPSQSICSEATPYRDLKFTHQRLW